MEQAIKIIVEQFAKERRSAVVLVESQPEADAVAQYCFRNVAERISRNGGSTQFGWYACIVRQNGKPVALIMEHHAVWRTPSGELIDITPFSTLPDGAAEGSGELLEEGRIVFVPDDTANLYTIPGFKYGGARPSALIAPLTRNKADRKMLREVIAMEYEYGRLCRERTAGNCRRSSGSTQSGFRKRGFGLSRPQAG
jgi:hypothetical protein